MTWVGVEALETTQEALEEDMTRDTRVYDGGHGGRAPATILEGGASYDFGGVLTWRPAADQCLEVGQPLLRPWKPRRSGGGSHLPHGLGGRPIREWAASYDLGGHGQSGEWAAALTRQPGGRRASLEAGGHTSGGGGGGGYDLGGHSAGGGGGHSGGGNDLSSYGGSGGGHDGGHGYATSSYASYERNCEHHH
ncbi:Hypothetical predicted protein [Cloeon dipterum]|uniref:Uncharacterized protein n=1 Tax=Cloeon dipterum TaxID=197152 RepID=A0A8S1E075_9INSE|nr:Hypothetical predicted protein [Cloeon dipterum]